MTDPIDHLAALAGLRLSLEERDRLGARLEVLQTLIDALPPSAAGGADRDIPSIPLREDDPGPALPVDEVIAMMPARSGSWLDAPPVHPGPS